MDRRAVLVHEIADARAALAAARELRVSVTLVSAPSGAAALGPGWWHAAVGRVRAEYPEVVCTAILDCGARADLVQAALRIGLRDLCFRGAGPVARKLADIAGRLGATLHRRPRKALDLTAVADRHAACRAWLSKSGPRQGRG
jgi:DNA-binding transcriptional LysR family regulator